MSRGGDRVDSRKNAFFRRVREWIAEPTTDHLIKLLQSTTDVIRADAEATSAPPQELVDALHGPPGKISVVALRMAGMSVTVAVTPADSAGAEQALRVWRSIRSCVCRWTIRPNHRAHRVERETLEPEIGALRITTPAGAVITIIDATAPHRAAVALLRALKAKVLLPAVAAGSGVQWAARKSREHPVIAGVAAAATALTAVMSGIAANEPADHHSPPAVWAPTTAATAPPEVSATSTPGPGTRPALPGAPLERSNRGKSRADHQTETPPHRPATRLTTAPARGETSPPLRGTAPTPAPATRPTPQPSGDQRTPPSPTPAGQEQTSQTAVDEGACDGILGVGATIDPLLGIDVCIG